MKLEISGQIFKKIRKYKISH